MTANATTELRVRNSGLRRVRVADLADAPWNHRTHPQAQQEALDGAIDELGFYGFPDVFESVGGTLMLIDGHLRKERLIARYGADAEIEVNVTDFDEAEAKKVNLTKDPLAAMAGANRERLDALLRECETGSDPLAKMLRELAKDAGCDWAKQGEVVEDEVPEPPANPVTKPGDLWLLGGHRLLCGDSTKPGDVARVMCGILAELLVTSPPYNQGIEKFKASGMHKEGDWVAKVGRLAYADSLPEPEYQENQKKCLAVWFDAMADGSSVFYNHKNRYRGKRIISPLEWLPGPFTIRQEIIWSRPGSVTQNARMFLPCDERIYWLYKGTGFYFDDSTEVKTWSTIWKIGLETNKQHAVAFPVELPARCIRACSRKEGIVFEPHAGSGTTIIAAEQLGRRCYGLEIEPRYCDVIVQRWEKLTGGKAVLDNPPALATNGKPRHKKKPTRQKAVARG